jgi:hypothetical protein
MYSEFSFCDNTPSTALRYLLSDPVVHGLSHLVHESDDVLVKPSRLVQVERSLQHLAQPLGACGT